LRVASAGLVVSILCQTWDISYLTILNTLNFQILVISLLELHVEHSALPSWGESSHLLEASSHLIEEPPHLIEESPHLSEACYYLIEVSRLHDSLGYAQTFSTTSLCSTADGAALIPPTAQLGLGTKPILCCTPGSETTCLLSFKLLPYF